MEPVVAAWKHTLSSGGNVQNRTPDSFGLTPSNIIAAGTPYTAALLARVSTDDLTFVGNSFSPPVSSTGRASHLFEFDVLTPAILQAISNLVRFSHLTENTVDVYTQRTYIRNAVALAWEQLATSTGNQVPRTMSGAVASNFPDYVNGSKKLYILHWDYEGVFRQGGGGGCLHSDTLVHTPSGKVLVSDLEPWDLILGYEGGVVVERRIDEVCRHSDDDLRSMVTLTTENGTVVVTANHTIPTGTGEMFAGRLRAGDLIQGKGELLKLLGVKLTEQSCDVYDVVARSPSLIVNGGMLVQVMEA